MATNTSFISPNQFAPLPTVGMCLNPASGQRLEVEYFPSDDDTTIGVCAPCKFVAGTGNINLCADIITSDAEVPTAGVLIYDSSKRNTYSAKQIMTVARVGSIVMLQASAAVTANQEVSIAPAGTVAPAAAGKNVIGYALTSAGVKENTRVLIIEPYAKAAASGG